MKMTYRILHRINVYLNNKNPITLAGSIRAYLWPLPRLCRQGALMSRLPDTIELAPEIQAVERATRWLESIAQRDAWPEKLSFGLILSLDEALTNLVSYAFDERLEGNAPTPIITVTCRRQEDQICLEIHDNGKPYDPTATSPAPLAQSLDDAKIGGHGLRLMQHYLQSLHYQRSNDLNHLTLIANATKSA